MKRAKFMLLGIGVLGVAGGAVAFNAKKFSGNLCCASLDQMNCNLDITYKASVSPERVPLHCTLQSSGCQYCTKTFSVTVND